MDINLFYNDEFIKSLTDEDLNFVLQHEAQHVLRGHTTKELYKSGKYNMMLANISQDILINESIDKTDISKELDEMMVHQKTFDALKGKNIDELTWMDIYKLIEDDPKTKKQRKNIDDHSKFGAPSEVEGMAADKAVRDAVKDALAANSKNKVTGNLPGSLRRQLGDLTAQVLNWKTILKMFAQTHSTQARRRTWSRVNRRYGFRSKGNKTVLQPNLLIVIDNSGSIEPHLYNKFIANVMEITKVIGAVDIIGCDTHVNYVGQVSHNRAPNMAEIASGGGTEFQPAYDYAKQNKFKNIIYFTDGCARMVENNHKIKALYILPRNGKKHIASHIKNIYLED